MAESPARRKAGYGRGGVKLGVGDLAGVEQLFNLIDSLYLGSFSNWFEVVETQRIQGRQCEQHRKDQDGTFCSAWFRCF